MLRALLVGFAAAWLVGCGAPMLPVTGNASGPVEPLGGLSFKPVSAQNMHLVGGAAPTAPMPAPTTTASHAPTMAPGGAVSGSLYDGYGYYGGGAPTTQPMALVSVTEAEGPGSRGPLKAILEGVMAPVLKDWAADAMLVSSTGILGDDGLSSWRLTYQALSRHEALNVVVAPQKTTLVRMRWAPINLAEQPFAVDVDAAVQKLGAAVKDPNAKSEEEKSGLDYFFGTTFEPVPTLSPYDDRIEVLYELAEGLRWNANFRLILGKRVWELNTYPMQAPTTDPSIYLNQSVSGMVDAQTGAVIRFTRPSKHYLKPQPSMPMSTPPVAQETPAP